jgi:hypothetical protein
MSIRVSNIIGRQHLAQSAATLYTARNVFTIVDKLTLTNTSNIAQSVTIYMPNPGGVFGNNNAVLFQRGIAPAETYQCPEIVGQVIQQGGTLVAAATQAGTVVISSTGRENSGEI